MKKSHLYKAVILSAFALAACSAPTPAPQTIRMPLIIHEGQKLTVPAEGILLVPSETNK